MLAQDRLGALALDRGARRGSLPCGAHRSRRRSNALGDAVVEADEAPPRAVDEDRHGGDRADALRRRRTSRSPPGSRATLPVKISLRALIGVEAREADLLEAHVLHDRVVELGRDPVGDPLEALARDHSCRRRARRSRTGTRGSPPRHRRAPRAGVGAASRQLGSATSRPAAWLTASRIASRRRRSRSARSRLTPAATSPAAARRASVSADAPVALALAVLEADEAPPGAVDEDRHGQDRERVDQLERLALVGGQVADVAAERLRPRRASSAQRGKCGAGRRCPSRGSSIVRHLAGGPAGAADRAAARRRRRRRSRTRNAPLAPVASPSTRIRSHHRVVEDRLREKVLGGSG